ncbi:integrase arm-type DNA-binding domain-containing protein [Methylobacterium sp. MA0201]|uniref:integrase arm-type DNA-binding domain-containing protein n=1 Tax=Methylobacterium alsaeris TaxID=3344826 RepID=UPI003756710F
MPKTASRGTYARERLHLTADVIRKARSMIAAGRFEGRGHEFLDTSCQGLTLRVTKASGTWYLRTRAATVRLGPMEDLPVAAAREAALRALVDLKAGRKTDPLDLYVFADVMKRTGDLDVAIDAGFPEVVMEQSDEDRRRRGPWQWRDLVRGIPGREGEGAEARVRSEVQRLSPRIRVRRSLAHVRPGHRDIRP